MLTSLANFIVDLIMKVFDQINPGFELPGIVALSILIYLIAAVVAYCATIFDPNKKNGFKITDLVGDDINKML